MATRVTVAGAQVTFPLIWPCCGAAADTAIHVRENRKDRPPIAYLLGRWGAYLSSGKGSFQVPYCSRCRDHARWSDGRLIWFLPVAVLAVIYLLNTPSS